MTAATTAPVSRWPAWVRRWTAIEVLGEPAVLGARLTIALSLFAILYVGTWNAYHYPITLGFDAVAHLEYAHVVIHQHRLPTPQGGSEANQPPAYYVIGGIAAEAGHRLFGWREQAGSSPPDPSYRGAQLLNVLLWLLTALCVLWLARTIAPRRPWVAAASVGYMAFLPIVAKTAAMFHPDNLAMLTTAAAVAATTHILVRRDFRWRIILLVVLALTLGVATRLASVFTLVAIVAGLAWAIARGPELRHAIPVRRVAAAIAAMLVLGLPWFVHEARIYHDPFGPTRVIRQAFDPHATRAVQDRSVMFHISFADAGAIIHNPWRDYYANHALPMTYTEIWGDWFGAMAWSPYATTIRPTVEKLLRDQSSVGVLPTILSLAGCLALLWAGIRRRPELLPAALVPFVAIAGYLYRSYLILTPDGDLFKASYVLTTAPVFALGFGLGSGWLAGRSRWARAAMVVAFAAFAVLELRFTMYGIRDHRPIF